MADPSNERNEAAKKWLTSSRIWWAIALGVLVSVGVVFWGLIQGESWRDWSNMQVAWRWIWWGVGFVLLRDFGYVIRLWVLSRGQLRLGPCLSSIFMWELASALTPSVVGGSAVASFVLHRNGMTWGRSLATVMATALLDELYFLIAVPMVALMVGFHSFLPEVATWLDGSVALVFLGGYTFMATLALFLTSALFWVPGRIQGGLVWLFQTSWLKSWSRQGQQLAIDLHQASIDLRGMSWKRWCAAIAATATSWTARFLTLNAVLLAFISPFMNDSTFSHFQVWARQLSMWTVMLISPTPGSTGLAELALPSFMADVMPVVLTAAGWGAIVLTWRFLTYHLYLLAGALIMPFWLTQTSSSN